MRRGVKRISVERKGLGGNGGRGVRWNSSVMGGDGREYRCG